MIKGIAFDLEGTVVDVEAAHHEAHLQVCRDRGFNMTLEEAIGKIKHFIGGPDKAVAEDILALTGTMEGETDPIQRILGADAAYYEKFLPFATIKPRPGFKTVYGKICDQRLRTSIGSLTDDDKAKFLLGRSRLFSMFNPKTIILKSHVKNLKPAPDVFLETARSMDIDPSEQLVFEDSPRGVQAARTAGSKAIGMPVYKNTRVIMELLEAGAERIFMDWREMNIISLLANLDGR